MSEGSDLGLLLLWRLFWVFLPSVKPCFVQGEGQGCCSWAFSHLSAGREDDSVISACLGGSREIKKLPGSEQSKQLHWLHLAIALIHPEPAAGAVPAPYLDASPPRLWMFFNEEGWEISLVFLFSAPRLWKGYSSSARLQKGLTSAQGCSASPRGSRGAVHRGTHTFPRLCEAPGLLEGRSSPQLSPFGWGALGPPGFNAENRRAGVQLSGLTWAFGNGQKKPSGKAGWLLLRVARINSGLGKWILSLRS